MNIVNKAQSQAIWVIMWRKNSDPIHVIFFFITLWLQCTLLCLPGSLEFGCSWTALQCESPQVINVAKSKCFYIFRQFFWKTLNFHISLTVRAFDLIPKLRARPEYHLSSGTKYIIVIPCDSHRHYIDIDTTQSILNNSSGPQ